MKSTQRLLLAVAPALACLLLATASGASAPAPATAPPRPNVILILTDVFFREAIAWMRERSGRGEPFFCYLPLNAPHTPLIVPDRYREPYRDQNPNVASYFGMIANIDENVGKLEAFLRDTGLRENTILIFTTDNGGTGGTSVSNAGMRGRKGNLYDVAADPGQLRDVFEQNPDVVAKLEQHYARWWAGVAPRVNEEPPIHLGSERENPTVLTPCHWRDGPFDQQIVFTVPLQRGPAELQTWFRDAYGQEICGAYYVYVRRARNGD